MKKFFVKNICFCCAGGDLCGKESEKKTTVPFKQKVAMHDIVSSANGNGAIEKQTYVNKGYTNDDPPVVAQAPLANSRPVYFRSRQLSQLSDISEIFRLPLPDERSLGDVMLEEYDSKSKTLHAAESGDLSDHGSRGSSRSASTEEETFSVNCETAKDRPDSSNSVSDSLNRSNSCCANQNEKSETVEDKDTKEFEDTDPKDSEEVWKCQENASDDETSDDDSSVTSLEVSFEEKSLDSASIENVPVDEQHYSNTSNLNVVSLTA